MNPWSYVLGDFALKLFGGLAFGPVGWDYSREPYPVVSAFAAAFESLGSPAFGRVGLPAFFAV